MAGSPLNRHTQSLFTSSVLYKLARQISMVSISSATWPTAALSLGAAGLFAALIVLVNSSFTAQSRSDQKRHLEGIHKLDANAMLSVLRIVQAVLATISTTAINQSFELIQWARTSHPRGISYTSFLAISPTTGPWGMFLLTMTPLARINLSSKLWVILRGAGITKLTAIPRALLSVMIWLSSVVLFFNTEIATIYDTALTYDVTAGVGPFNSSLVQPYLDKINSLDPNYQYGVLPYNDFTVAYNLVTNPTYATSSHPIQCENTLYTDCFSYLLSGGIVMTTPWPPRSDLDYPLIRLENVPSIQIEFQKPHDNEFADTECDLFRGPGGQTVAFCVARVQVGIGTWKAGLFLCSNNTDTAACLRTTPTPNITTTLTFFERQATIITGRSNFSITSTDSLTPPIPMTREGPDGGLDLLHWLLNATDAAIPWPSSILENFWVSWRELQKSPVGTLTHSFQSILAFPLWLFNANNYGNPALREEDMVPGLPRQFYTEAAVVRPYTKISFSRGMFNLFNTLQAAGLAFVWGVLLWLWIGFRGGLPMTVSSFPLFDAAFKTQVDAVARQPKILRADGAELMDIMMGCTAKVKSS
ncbi:hypothetical protein PG991_010762 [Apiospora marii]|uniref:Uncharacterized protein n=1 Tax=Apiospora marii TaxID=335849 RepID=A0ABR1RCE2_9PEZI